MTPVTFYLTLTAISHRSITFTPIGSRQTPFQQADRPPLGKKLSEQREPVTTTSPRVSPCRGQHSSSPHSRWIFTPAFSAAATLRAVISCQPRVRLSRRRMRSLETITATPAPSFTCNVCACVCVSECRRRKKR